MALRTKEVENQPFLNHYHDDSSLEDQSSRTDKDDLSQAPAKRKCFYSSHIVVIIITSLCWMLLMLLSSASTFRSSWAGSSHLNRPSWHNITTGARRLECGSSPAEARANNCKYDVLLNSWVPEPCYDQEFIDEYLDDASWAAYADANLTTKLNSVEEMSERTHYYTTVSDHINHCAIMWKRQFWQLYEERRYVDSMSADPHHTDHCALYLSEVRIRNPTEATEVEVTYAGCWDRWSE